MKLKDFNFPLIAFLTFAGVLISGSFVGLFLFLSLQPEREHPDSFFVPSTKLVVEDFGRCVLFEVSGVTCMACNPNGYLLECLK